MPSSRSKKLNSDQVDDLIEQLLKSGEFSYSSLYAFALKVNGSAFKKPLSNKAKGLTMAAAKKAVLDKFGCSTVAELRRNKTFSMSMAGEVISLKSKEDWMRLYRRWVGVPDSERN